MCTSLIWICLTVQSLVRLTVEHPAYSVDYSFEPHSEVFVSSLEQQCSSYKFFLFSFKSLGFAKTGLVCIRCWSEDVQGDGINRSGSCWLWDGSLRQWNWGFGQSWCCRPWFKGITIDWYEHVYLTRVIKCCGSWFQVILDEFVKPDKPVVDYRTDITGITAEDIEKATLSLVDIQVHSSN